MAAYRNYANAPAHVRDFYWSNHAGQTMSFVLTRKETYRIKSHKRLGMWQALELLDTLVDASDPDTSQSQMQHALQTAQAIRKTGLPDWFQLTGLIHDAGKMLCAFGEPQWAVVGDTFPVGCRYSEKIVFPEFFTQNPDNDNPEYQTANGVYEPGCGLDKVHFSWGHDEYLYQVLTENGATLPPAALAMVRYHSAYVIHKDGEYQHLLNNHDRTMLPWVRQFQDFDLYPKHSRPVDAELARPHYEALIAKYLPGPLSW